MKKYIKSILIELAYASFFCHDTKEPKDQGKPNRSACFARQPPLQERDYTT